MLFAPPISHRHRTLPALVIACVSTAAFAGDLVVHYDASQGVLPTERCWEAVGSESAPPPTLVDGALVHGLTGYGNWSYFEHNFPPLSFAEGAAIEASIKVDSSTWYAIFPYQRSGFYLTLSDNAGNWAYLGISGDRVLLQTADQNWSDQSSLFNTTRGFHTYRLEINGAIASVSIDGTVVLTGTVAGGSVPNQAIFGDISVLGNSKTRTKYVKVEGVPVCSIADMDCSGHVDAMDLAVLIGAWGTSLCEADLDDDGVVDGQDLAILLGLWG
jgi:hypothetical protein